MFKIIGAIIGYIVAGFWGLVLGLVCGHFIDRRMPGMLLKLLKPMVVKHQARVQRVFFETTFLVMGHLAKADGRVTEQEIQLARQIMQRMNLSKEATREAMELFGRGKEAGFDLDAALNALRGVAYGQRGLIRMFFEIQLAAAYADGEMEAPERTVLLRACQILGVAEADFNQIDNMIRAELHNRRSRQPGGGIAIEDAYAILGVEASASDADVKRAFRRLTSQHHPDKLQAKGLPPEMMKLAEEKTVEIRNAYERIRETRGFK